MVTRCVCNEVPFSRLWQLHRDHGHALPELSRLTRCGTKCGSCLPYIRLMLLTGRTAFPPLTPRAFEQLGVSPDTTPME